MASQSEVTAYTSYVKRSLAVYGNKLATKYQIGQKPSFDKVIKLMLLSSFEEIAARYLEQWDSTTDDNLMTVAEFEEIMEHINRIAQSFHWLELE